MMRKKWIGRVMKLLLGAAAAQTANTTHSPHVVHTLQPNIASISVTSGPVSAAALKPKTGTPFIAPSVNPSHFF